MLAQCPACRISIRLSGLITPLDKKTPHPTKKTQINQNLFTFLLTILCKRKKFPTRLITQYAEGDEAWNGEQEVIFSLIHKNSSFEGFHEWSEHHTHTRKLDFVRMPGFWSLSSWTDLSAIVSHNVDFCGVWIYDFVYALILIIVIEAGFCLTFLLHFICYFYNSETDRQTDGQTSSDYCCY